MFSCISDSPGSLLVDFYLRFLSTIPNPVQLFLNLVKTGFIGGIPVDKLPGRLYNGTGELREGICYVTDIPVLNCLNRRVGRLKEAPSSFFIQWQN